MTQPRSRVVDRISANLTEEPCSDEELESIDLLVGPAGHELLALSRDLVVVRRRTVRSPRLGATFDALVRDVDDDRGGVAVAHFALASDLLELVTARRQVLQQRARKAIFDLRQLAVLARIRGIAARQKPRRLDRGLRAELAVDDAE